MSRRFLSKINSLLLLGATCIGGNLLAAPTVCIEDPKGAFARGSFVIAENHDYVFHQPCQIDTNIILVAIPLGEEAVRLSFKQTPETGLAFSYDQKDITSRLARLIHGVPYSTPTHTAPARVAETVPTVCIEDAKRLLARNQLVITANDAFMLHQECRQDTNIVLVATPFNDDGMRLVFKNNPASGLFFSYDEKNISPRVARLIAGVPYHTAPAAAAHHPEAASPQQPTEEASGGGRKMTLHLYKSGEAIPEFSANGRPNVAIMMINQFINKQQYNIEIENYDAYNIIEVQEQFEQKVDEKGKPMFNGTAPVLDTAKLKNVPHGADYVIKVIRPVGRVGINIDGMNMQGDWILKNFNHVKKVGYFVPKNNHDDEGKTNASQIKSNNPNHYASVHLQDDVLNVGTFIETLITYKPK